MKKYSVLIKQTGYAEVEIKAKNEDEAEQIAKDKCANGDGDTIPDDFSWDFTYEAEEIDECDTCDARPFKNGKCHEHYMASIQDEPEPEVY